MEVLGTYCPLVKDGVKEIRLRFSRVKFWLGAGSEVSKSMRYILAEAGLIPQPPPLHGWRAQLWGDVKEEVEQEREQIHKEARRIYADRSDDQKGVFAK
jgi:hypothetical protein